MTAVTICDTREKLQNCRFIAKKGKNLAKKGKYEPSSAFDSVTICDHCDQLIPPHTTSYHIVPHLGAPVEASPQPMLLYAFRVYEIVESPQDSWPHRALAGGWQRLIHSTRSFVDSK